MEESYRTILFRWQQNRKKSKAEQANSNERVLSNLVGEVLDEIQLDVLRAHAKYERTFRSTRQRRGAETGSNDLR
jgi:hypothetical protein